MMEIEYGPDGKISGVSREYNFIKLHSTIYPEFGTQCYISRDNENAVLRFLQEDNYSDTFPRQLIEITVPNGDFTRDCSLINTMY